MISTELVRRLRHLIFWIVTFSLAFNCLLGPLWRVGRRRCPSVNFCFGGSIPQVGLKFRTSLIKCDSMSERTNDSIRGSKRQSFRDDTNRVDGIPNTGIVSVEHPK